MPYNIGGVIRKYRTRVTVSSSHVDSNLTGFTHNFHIANMASWIVDLMNSTGGDSIITDSSGIRLPIHVQNFNQGTYTGVISALTSLASSGGTEFHVYFGDFGAGVSQPGAATTYGYNNVTRASVKMRLTCDESPVGSYVLLDSTGNGNHADPTNMVSGDSITGKVNNALAFAGVDEHAQVDHSSDLNPAQGVDFSVEFTFRIPSGSTQPSTGGGWHRFFGKLTSLTQTPYEFVFYDHTHGSLPNQLRFARWDGTNVPVIHSTNTYNDANFHHATFWKTGSTLYLKIDDASLQSTSDTTHSNDCSNDHDINIAKSGLAAEYIIMDLDEILFYYGEGVGEAHSKARAANILTPASTNTWNNRVETFDQGIKII